MSTPNAIMNMGRAYAGRPGEDKISRGDLFIIFMGRYNYYKQKLGLTNQNWIIDSFFFTVNQGESDSAIQCGRPIKVEFYDPNYPSRNGPEIEIIDLQDTNLPGSQGGYNTSSSISFNQTSLVASTVAFYGVPPNRRVRFTPEPSESVQYKIWHEPVTTQALSQEDEVIELMPQFHDLLAMSMALVMLPRCGYDQATFQMYFTSLAQERDRLEQVFDHYRMANRHADTRLRRQYVPGGSNSWRSR